MIKRMGKANTNSHFDSSKEKSNSKNMIKVRIKFIGTLREVLGKTLGEANLPRGTILKDALVHFATIFGKPFQEEVIDLKLMRLQPFINIMINGQNAIRQQGLQTILHDNDELLMIPPITGGSENLIKISMNQSLSVLPIQH